MMFPKPTKRKKAKKPISAIEKWYMLKVKVQPCVICGSIAPNDAHHVFHDRYSQRKASSYATIPLCKRHHQVGPEAIHVNKSAWREQHGPDWSYIPQTLQAIYGDQFSEDH